MNPEVLNTALIFAAAAGDAVRCGQLLEAGADADASNRYGNTPLIMAAQHGDVLIVTKRAREESNTKYAQGGIAAVLDDSDTFEAHVKDTIVAGANLNHPRAVDLTVRDAPSRIAISCPADGGWTQATMSAAASTDAASGATVAPASV